MKTTIKFDTGFLLGEAGISFERMSSFEDRLVNSISWLKELDATDQISFLRLPSQTENIKIVKELAENVPDYITEVVILGIGGSSLGPRAIYKALKPPFYNEFPSGRRLHFPDNVDPVTFNGIFKSFDLNKTLFLVITKSGGTAETAVQLMYTWNKLVETFGEEGAKNHIIAVTDPKNGNLRKLVNELGLKNAPIPPNVGGRFSVLSAVGLLPALLVGVDIDALLAGAKKVSDDFYATKGNENPAVQAAGLYYLLHTEKQKPIHVLMPYYDGLFATSQWFNQLWGESLGKRKNLQGEDIFVGPTPVAARGATDQHSQLQLFAEGPRDKIVTFITVDELDVDLEVPKVFNHLDSYSYLGGVTFGELLKIEQNATSLALGRGARPNCTIHIPKLNASTLGELFMFFEIVTALSGKLYNIDPFNQPGVEQGKKYAYGALGRDGFDQEKKIMDDFMKSH